jgi:MarR family transcriptional regulator for hemolysin
MRRFEERLRPFGFGMASLQVVFALSREGALQQKDLLEFIHVEQPTMAALLGRMERDQLITRTPDPKDPRAQLIALTPRAKKARIGAKAAMQDVVEEAMAGVTESDRENLIRILQVVIVNLSGERAEESTGARSPMKSDRRAVRR